MSGYETVISSNKKWFDFEIKETLKYKDLIILFVKRNFILTYKQTILGPLWIFLNPLVTSVVFTFIFGQIAEMDTAGVPPFLFYMLGNTLWSFFSTSFTGIGNTFVNNSHILGKVYFPRIIMPISTLITSFLNFLIQMIMFMLFLLYYLFQGMKIRIDGIPYWMIPVALVQIGLLALGSGIIVSAVTTKYRDLAIAVGFGIQLWMYLSPVVYTLSAVSGKMKTILCINPISMPIEMIRLSILGQGEVITFYCILEFGFTLIIFFVGVVLFNRVQKTFVDTV